MLPRLWLMTDERQGEALWPALARMPRGSGVIVRHYSLGAGPRRALFRRVAHVAARRGILVSWAGSIADAVRLRAGGVHLRSSGRAGRGHPHRQMVRSAAVHGIAEMRRAERSGADLLLVSPVFATASHRDARPIGIARFARMVREARRPVIALGGVTDQRFRRLRAAGAYGWAAIDGLTPGRSAAIHDVRI